MRILVTGGAGYVGSHIAVELLQRGDEVVVVDSLERGYREAVERASAIAGRPIALLVGDLCDRTFLDAVFEDAPVDAVLHCAAF
ncbi:MAG: SDR family NAD(P)-dependent oxidoreductase, partial [Deltaproteobacteria bacterium]|nr:SDR family NAD(P)-dependent oxidoreductase [Deltaproteobacteria bacterium]